nr:7-cyano-7-deazaguanine synthase [Teredinibacter turnerae]
MILRGCLLSGGMDSLALAFMVKPDFAFNIDYGQKCSRAERRASREFCRNTGIPLVELDIDCSCIGSGDLNGTEPASVAPKSDWWPFRNQLLITLCAAKAIEVGCSKLDIGTVCSDEYHVDGSSKFIEKMNDLLSLQEGGISLDAPAIHMTTVELVQRSQIPFDLLALSHSCHKANIPCTNCRGCNKHYSCLKDLGYCNG